MTDQQLKIRDKVDAWLMTVFMNEHTRTEVASYPRRRTFFAEVGGETVKVYATDPENAAKFLATKYKIEYPVALLEERITYTEVLIN